MKNYQFIFLFFFYSNVLQAQAVDNFSDGNFTQDPVWSGSSGHFIINASQQLQLNNSLAGSSFLSTSFAASSIDNFEWQVFVRQAFSPSGSNYGRVYLTSDQMDLSALQSLVMMNDPVYVEAARVLAARVLREGGSTLRQQLTHAFRLTLARPPEGKEIDVLEKTYRQQLDNFTHDPKAAGELLKTGESPRPPGLDPASLAAMTGVASVLLNLNEAITR